MRKARVLGVGLVAAGLAAVVFFYGFIGRGGLAADRAPGALETAVAQRLVRLSIPGVSRNATTPDGAGDAWRQAVDHFGEHCAVCHGGDGHGRSEIGPRMYPPVPDLAAGAVQHLSDGELFWIIQNGISWTGMPAFRSSHSDEETWKLVSLIRHLPTLTAADLQHADAPAAHPRDAATVVMDGTQFQPATLTVALGETVTFVNTDPFPHNVASDAGGFHSGELKPDQSWRFRPASRGTFRYTCTLHPTMVATLRVK